MMIYDRIAMQLGMIEYPKELEANATSEEADDDVTQTEEAAAEPKQQEEVSESDSE